MDITPAKRFAATFDAVLRDIQGIIKELNIDKFCTITESAVELARGVIAKYNIETVIYAFAKIHPYWEKVKMRSSEFVINDLNTIIKQSGVPLDTTILSIPLLCYQKIKGSDKWKNVSQDDWPVNDDDIDEVWTKFLSLLKITCSWVNQKRLSSVELRKKNLLTEDEKETIDIVEILKDLDLSKYEVMFSFKI